MRWRSHGQGTSRHRLALGAILVLACAASSQAADAAPASEARRLTDQALATYHRAEATHDGFAEIYDQGLAEARRAIALDPTIADAHYAVFLNLGRKSQRSSVAAQFRNVSELKAELAKTLELDPKHADAWEAQGEMLLKLPRLFGGSATEGEKALRRSQELAPTWAKPPLRLAQLHQENGKVDEARAEATLALDLAKKSGSEAFAKEAAEVINALAAAPR